MLLSLTVSTIVNSNIHNLLAGINFYPKLYQPSTSSSLFSNPAVRLLLRGISKHCFHLPDSRKPITLPVLRSLVAALRGGPFSPYVKAFLLSAFLLAFYGFLRLSEFTSTAKVFNPSRDLTISDLKFYPDHYDLFIKHSKVKGLCTISIARLGGSFCPFHSMFKFVCRRHKLSPLSIPLFLNPEGFPMTAAWFICHLRQTLALCSLPPCHFSGHSFRIGAAMSAAIQGIPSASLLQLGHSSSSAFSSYIRPDLPAVLEAQCSLSTGKHLDK